MAKKSLPKRTVIENSVAGIRKTVTMVGLRSGLAKLRNCCVCLVVDPRHAGARRELGQVLLADLHDAFEAGTLARAYAEEVRSHGEDLALRLDPEAGDDLDIRTSAVRLSQAVDAFLDHISQVQVGWRSSDEDFQRLIERLLFGPPHGGL